MSPQKQTIRPCAPGAAVELDRPDVNPDGSLYAWGKDVFGREVLWTRDDRLPPGKQECIVAIEHR